MNIEGHSEQEASKESSQDKALKGIRMSKLETLMTRWYWRQVGGTLIEEFPAVRRRKDRGQRLIDGTILPEGEHKTAHWKDVSLKGKDIIIVQTKRGRLGNTL